jgi:DNA-binding beta-propeller fold protein YncE
VTAMDTGIELVVDGTAQVLDTDVLPVAAVDGVLHLGAALAVPDGRWVTVRAGSDDYVASIPSDAFTLGAELTVATRRLMVREGSTLCWNVKDVRRIEVGDERQPDSVPEKPPH